MNVGTLWDRVSAHAAALPLTKKRSKRPSIEALLRSNPAPEVIEGIRSLTNFYKTSRGSDRNPSFAQLEAMVKTIRHLSLVELQGQPREAKGKTDAVAEYTARLKRILAGSSAGFFEILDEMEADPRVKTNEIREIVSAVLGISVSRISKKAARSALVDEFATIQVGRVSTDAAKRSRPY